MESGVINQALPRIPAFCSSDLILVAKEAFPWDVIYCAISLQEGKPFLSSQPGLLHTLWKAEGHRSQGHTF